MEGGCWRTSFLPAVAIRCSECSWLCARKKAFVASTPSGTRFHQSQHLPPIYIRWYLVYLSQMPRIFPSIISTTKMAMTSQSSMKWHSARHLQHPIDVRQYLGSQVIREHHQSWVVEAESPPAVFLACLPGWDNQAMGKVRPCHLANTTRLR